MVRALLMLGSSASRSCSCNGRRNCAGKEAWCSSTFLPTAAPAAKARRTFDIHQLPLPHTALRSSVCRPCRPGRMSPRPLRALQHTCRRVLRALRHTHGQALRDLLRIRRGRLLGHLRLLRPGASAYRCAAALRRHATPCILNTHVRPSDPIKARKMRGAHLKLHVC